MVILRRSLLCLLSIGLAIATPTGLSRADGDPVRLAVYIESLCPDSINFMRNQLYPTWNELSDIMDVNVVSYGFVTEVPTAEGGYLFSCQHGHEECLGNIMLACAKTYIPDNTQYVDFSLCVMMSDDPPHSGEACAVGMGLDYSPIGTCEGSLEGELLLHELGVEQNALDPTVDWVPWMVLNDEHTDEIQQSAEFDLKNTICGTYTGTTPDPCLATNE